MPLPGSGRAPPRSERRRERFSISGQQLATTPPLAALPGTPRRPSALPPPRAFFLQSGTFHFSAGATAVGANAHAGAAADGQTNATAVGGNAFANALNATAVGAEAQANFSNATALAQAAQANAVNATAVGQGALA